MSEQLQASFHRLVVPQAQIEPLNHTLDPKLMLDTAMRLSQTLLGLLEPEAIAEAAFAVIHDFLQPDAISLLVRDSERIRLDLIAADGWSQAHVGKLSIPLNPPGSSGVAWAAHTREPVFKNHTHPNESYTSVPVVLQAGVETSLIVPMLVPQSHTSARPASPVQVQQMVTNLVLNARDAMPEGGEIRFRISKHTRLADEPAPFRDLPPGDWVVLTVSDTGVGMPPEVLERVFEPFFTTKEPGKGTGLGLAQVYGIIRQHDGYIDVQSELGKGTKFFIYLPAPIEPAETIEEKGLEEIASGDRETILVVEDQPAVLEVTRAMLQHLGYRVLTSSTGDEALAMYTQHSGEIPLVIADMVMPGMSGVELYYALKEINHSVRVILMTGYPLGEDARELLAEGIVDWVQKPLNLKQLAHVVQLNISGRLN